MLLKPWIATVASLVFIVTVRTSAQDDRPAASSRPAPAPPRYRLTDLGAGFHATDLNDRGQVVGYRSQKAANGDLSAKTILWENGKQREIGQVVGASGFDHRLNNRSQVTTRVEDKGFAFAGIQHNGKRRSVGTLPDKRYSVARDINDAGLVVGGSGSAEGVLGERAVMWKPGSPVRDLGNLGGEPADASCINNGGAVAGESALKKGYFQSRSTIHAFLWSQGKMRDLGALRGDRESKATGINDVGEVVGVSGESSVAMLRAFLWSKGRMQPLPVLSGHDQSHPHAINDARQIVGYSCRRLPHWDVRAVLWQDEAVYDLTRLVPLTKEVVLKRGIAVNQRGEILAVGSLRGQFRCFLLRPESGKDQPRTGTGSPGRR